MNNYERIKQMTVEEMALLLNCECCIYNDGDLDCEDADCQNAVKEWLLTECEWWETPQSHNLEG